MSQCCDLGQSLEEVPGKPRQYVCPVDGTSGKPVRLVTLKSLLIGAALEKLVPENIYAFCPSSTCSVVYSASHIG